MGSIHTSFIRRLADVLFVVQDLGVWDALISCVHG